MRWSDKHKMADAGLRKRAQNNWDAIGMLFVRVAEKGTAMFNIRVMSVKSP